MPVSDYKVCCLSRVLVPDENKHTYWLSFCDPNKPEGERFLGCILIDATDFTDAIRACWQLAINPGGEVQGIVMPNTLRIDAAWKQRLLTRDECKELEAELYKQQN